MADKSTKKRFNRRLMRLIEQAVAEACNLPGPGFWFCLDEVEVTGSPPYRLRVWATLHFFGEGSPFCCGEPECHLVVFGERLKAVGESVRRAMGLQIDVAVEFDERIGVSYHDG